MNRQQIQQEALKALKLNNYNGTICLSTGSGKSKIAIDVIKEGNFKNILITSPRTNLKDNWSRELEKWGEGWLFGDTHTITLENIQTCYKWTKDEISRFDLIISDEVHTMSSDKYGNLIINAVDLCIPVIGLTATPSLHIEDKTLFYENYIPIIYEYYNSAEDGIINKRKYYIYQYELSDEHKVIAGTKKKPFIVGEKTQYEYLSSQLKRGQILMSQTGSQDWFRDAANWGWGGQGTPQQRSAAITYLNAIKYRKEFLWNLTSSAEITKQIKDKILNAYKGINIYTGDNMNLDKVLLFSELTSQAEKISPYSIHSKQDEESNKQLLFQFDSGNIRELSSVRSLTLGLNIKGANWAIIESYNSSPTDIIQKMGRTDRLSIDDVANVVIIVPKGTQAEEWFKTFSKSLDLSEAIYINDVKELKI
jgi:superfamily II DNA or RNA helicase